MYNMIESISPHTDLNLTFFQNQCPVKDNTSQLVYKIAKAQMQYFFF